MLKIPSESGTNELVKGSQDPCEGSQAVFFFMFLKTTVSKIAVSIDLPHLTKRVYDKTEVLLDRLLKSKIKNRNSIAQAFLYALANSRGANASDLWHHVVYRLYCKILPRYYPQDPKQSWVRASGDALEVVLEELYRPVLSAEGISLIALTSRKAKKLALAAFGIDHLVGDSKLDLALYTASGKIFGGAHVKASLAERVSDDVPCSRALIEHGYWSPLWTLDVKSFPPPQGDLVNRGELGSPDSPTEKRKYIELHGSFDNCYSANSRTVPSSVSTNSKKRIYSLDLLHQPDQFAQDVIIQALRH